jgi:hypothetical protein
MVHHLAKFDHIWLGRLSGTRSSIWGSNSFSREHGAAATAWHHGGGCGGGLCIYRKGVAGGGMK